MLGLIRTGGSRPSGQRPLPGPSVLEAALPFSTVTDRRAACCAFNPRRPAVVSRLPY